MQSLKRVVLDILLLPCEKVLSGCLAISKTTGYWSLGKAEAR